MAFERHQIVGTCGHMSPLGRKPGTKIHLVSSLLMQCCGSVCITIGCKMKATNGGWDGLGGYYQPKSLRNTVMVLAEILNIH